MGLKYFRVDDARHVIEKAEASHQPEVTCWMGDWRRIFTFWPQV